MKRNRSNHVHKCTQCSVYIVSIAVGKHTLLGHRYICMYVCVGLIQKKSVCVKEGIKSQYRYTLTDRTEWCAFNSLCFHNNTRKTSSCCPRDPRRPRTTSYTSCTPWRFSCCTARHCQTSATCHCRTEYGTETQEGV